MTRDKRWLLILAALSVLPFLLSAGYSLLQLSQSTRDEVAGQLVVKANSTAQAVKARLTASVAALDAIASSDAALRGDLPALYQQAQRVLLHLPENSAITLTSPKGEVLFDTLQAFGSPIRPSRMPEVWKRVFETAQTATSEPYTSPVSGRLVAAVGVPVFHHGKVAYCLSMVFLSASLSDLLRAQHLPPDWPMEIISATGTRLAHSRDADVNLGRPAPAEVRAAQDARMQGLFDSHTPGDASTKTIVVPVDNFDWAVAMTVPMVALNEPVQQGALLLLIFGGAFAILGGLAVTWPTLLWGHTPAEPVPQASQDADTAGSLLMPSVVALATSLALGGYTAWLTQSNVQQLTTASAARQAIADEQRQIEELQSLFSDLETGHRGIVMTSHAGFLEPLDAAAKLIPALTRRLKTSFARSELHDFNWSEFDLLSDQIMASTSMGIAMRRARREAALPDDALFNEDRLTRDKLNLQFDELSRRLGERLNRIDDSIALQQSRVTQQQWLSSFAVSALFLLAVAIWFHERQKRIHIHSQLEMSKDLLETRVEQRTRELLMAQQRIRLHAQEAQALLDSERKRLSREVHDQVGQIFTGIKMIAGSLKGGSLDGAQQAALLEAVDSGVKISRRIAAELRPPLLDDFGLHAALEHFIKSACQPAALSYELHFPQEHQLTTRQTTELFRMVQEACINVIRHARAMHLEVVGRIVGDCLEVCIEDDGVGFEQASVREDALGILGMRERAHLMDAQIHIGRSPMGGTRVHIMVRLAQAGKRELS